MTRTSGHWRVNVSAGGINVSTRRVISTDSTIICDVRDFGCEGEANAHLIAAAPALYESLRKLLAIGFDAAGSPHAIDAANRAIAIADGKEP